MRPLAALALLVALASAAPVPKEIKKKDDKARLVGTWAAVALNGKPQPAGTYTFTFDADGGVNLQTGGGSASEWTWTIDPTESPKRMKWVDKKNPATSWECVYELTGDTFKLGFVPPGQPTPATVEVTPGVTLYEMTRDTSEK